MIPEAAAALVATAALWLGDLTNRKLVGWLPDDPPRPGRKQHGRPVPLAGVLLLPATLPWILAEGDLWLAIACLLGGAIGFLDDRGKEHGRDLDWRYKALGLGFAAVAAAASVGSSLATPYAFAGALGFLFVLTNATNFLDNCNGVCAALSGTSLLWLSGGHGPFAAAGFAAFAFLPWNWPRARLFLGDAGAYQLGLLVATAALRGCTEEPLALSAVAVQLADFVQVVTARLVLGLPPWVGDRRHLTHIAQNLGLPAPWVAPATAAVAALLAWLGN
jgi:UDP-N-acetylmuramyl pentapeptide phosphotransferase/UDP-N-acetylglucosamine-1-phosphate transferase